jgi:hypothetical protein
MKPRGGQFAGYTAIIQHNYIVGQFLLKGQSEDSKLCVFLGLMIMLILQQAKVVSTPKYSLR